MPWIVLQSPGKSSKFTKKLSSMHPKGNTKLKNENLWVTLISSFDLSFFLMIFLNTTKQTAQDIQQRKHS